MKTIRVKVYQYNELSEAAKAKARDWWLSLDTFDAEGLVSEFKAFLEDIGFAEVDVHYSGFGSQGDGACFDFKGLDFKKFSEAGDGWGSYSELHRITAAHGPNRKDIRNACRITDCLEAWSVRTSFAHHYSHSKTRWAEVSYCGRRSRCLEALEIRLKDMLTTFCREASEDFYSSLEKEYDYTRSEEYVAEAMEANDYTFTKDGKRFG
jgi:hypothetical protein